MWASVVLCLLAQSAAEDSDRADLQELLDTTALPGTTEDEATAALEQGQAYDLLLDLAARDPVASTRRRAIYIELIVETERGRDPESGFVATSAWLRLGVRLDEWFRTVAAVGVSAPQPERARRRRCAELISRASLGPLARRARHERFRALRCGVSP